MKAFILDMKLKSQVTSCRVENKGIVLIMLIA